MGKKMDAELFFSRHKEHLFKVTTSNNISNGPDILSGEDIEKDFCGYPSFGNTVEVIKKDHYELLRSQDSGDLSLCTFDRTRQIV